METSEIKKIKSQKRAALFLMVGSAILILSYIKKEELERYGANNYIILGTASFFLSYTNKDDLEMYGNNNYIILGALLTLNAIGIYAFFRSYSKLKKLM